MFPHTSLKTTIFFDIETVPLEKDLKTFEQNHPHLYDGLLKNYEVRKTGDISLSDYYDNNAGIIPEYGQVACFSYAILKDPGVGKEFNADFSITSKSYNQNSIDINNEKELLINLSKFLDKVWANNYNLGGHNIKQYDIPFLIKRFIANSLPIPKILHIFNKKPWEIKFIDTKEIYNFGSNFFKSTLFEICLIMGLDNPKDNIDGSQVSHYFHNLKKYNEIEKYCEKDAIASLQIALKLSNYYN